MKRNILLVIAFLEGFTTLAFQMVALRKAIPFVGSSIVLTSIVIGIILLALSAGYFMGGKLTSHLSESQLLHRLQLYLLIAALYYLLIVYPSFSWVLVNGLQNIGYIPTLFLFSLIFFAVPTYLASHTMPIITHVTQGTKGYAAGKILFISTLGSFLGSTITTLVLFPGLGIYWTGIVASFILLLCGFLVYFGRPISGTKQKIIGCIVMLIFLGVTITTRPQVLGYYRETPYQTIEISEGFSSTYNQGLIRVLHLNGGSSSGIYTNTKKSFFGYIREMLQVIHQKKPQKIAVIGAAGCTLPQEAADLDFVEHIDVIDIDKAVFDVAEKYFLQEPLHDKITPIVQSARGWVYDMIEQKNSYDMIIVDVYNGVSLPDEVLTYEFFADLKKITSHIVINIITDQELQSPFSQSLLATMQKAWGNVYMQNATMGGAEQGLGNLVISNQPDEKFTLLPTVDAPLYTDDKNNADELRVQMMYQYF